jgi:hypothetical protein
LGNSHSLGWIWNCKKEPFVRLVHYHNGKYSCFELRDTPLPTPKVPHSKREYVVANDAEEVVDLINYILEKEESR